MDAKGTKSIFFSFGALNQGRIDSHPAQAILKIRPWIFHPEINDQVGIWNDNEVKN
ncbi:hypothetical protein VRK_13450 [Vibrio sp. MEBiC08052]|nr:hypothetical protein VRK_13450 [Vibrio sp. MEBiC08052]